MKIGETLTLKGRKNDSNQRWVIQNSSPQRNLSIMMIPFVPLLAACYCVDQVPMSR